MRVCYGKGVMLALILAAATPSGAPAQPESERELARLRAGIAELEETLARQIGRRDDGVAALRQIELSLAATRTELRTLAAAIGAQSARQAGIAAERRAAAARLAGEEAALAEQVRMSYMTGREELVKLLLSQESPADFGRMLVYYDYLNRHRGERIGAVDAELARLAGLARESESVALELERLEAERAAELARLEREQTGRRALIAELDEAIETSGDRIERMRAEAAELDATIARLADLLEDFPVTSDAPFSAQQGALPWPIEGRIAARFGDNRDDAGIVRWDAVLLEAEAGTIVRAVYRGQVAYAQWHSGMGLLLILDHGEGFMTLYGHNGALLREPGDFVAAGDAIAEVGDTGGQLGTGLYFGIRRNAEPVNPADWVR